MTTKGPHTGSRISIDLCQQGYCIQVSFAGFEFQKGLQIY